MRSSIAASAFAVALVAFSVVPIATCFKFRHDHFSQHDETPASELFSADVAQTSTSGAIVVDPSPPTHLSSNSQLPMSICLPLVRSLILGSTLENSPVPTGVDLLDFLRSSCKEAFSRRRGAGRLSGVRQRGGRSRAPWKFPQQRPMENQPNGPDREWQEHGKLQEDISATRLPRSFPKRGRPPVILPAQQFSSLTEMPASWFQRSQGSQPQAPAERPFTEMPEGHRGAPRSTCCPCKRS